MHLKPLFGGSVVQLTRVPRFNYCLWRLHFNISTRPVVTLASGLQRKKPTSSYSNRNMGKCHLPFRGNYFSALVAPTKLSQNNALVLTFIAIALIQISKLKMVVRFLSNFLHFKKQLRVTCIAETLKL